MAGPCRSREPGQPGAVPRGHNALAGGGLCVVNDLLEGGLAGKQIASQPAMLLEPLLNMNTTIAATLHRTSDFRSNLRDGCAQWPGSTRHLHSARPAICIVPPKAEDGRLPGWHHARLPVELRFNGCPGSPGEGRAALAARWMTSPAVVPAGRNEPRSLPDPGCQRPGDPHLTGGAHGARTSGR